MSGRFVRASKYRHVYGQPVKKELQYENLRITSNAWDSNLLKTNGKYISVNWNSSGGGAFAVIPVSEVGKLPDQIPLFRGHTAQVLDTDFDPFNDDIVASASDDGKIGIWKIPEDYSAHGYVDEEGEPKDIEPLRMLSGHSRKVGHILFHPTAENILASSSLDYTVKIWDINEGEVKFTLKHPDMVTSMSFNYNGDYLATVSRDKKLRVWDIRAEKVVSEGPGHSGAKNQRIVWLGNTDRIATTGFSRLSDRQIGVWDAFNLDKGDLGGFYTLDQSSGILMPFYDPSNKILYVAGKGDGNIRYYEFQNDELYELSEYQSTDPQRGVAVAPKRAVNVKENEVLKAYKAVGDHTIEPISFFVPRKSDVFQEDIYPDAPANKPALSGKEWVQGKSVDGPVLFKLYSLFDGSKPEYTKSQKPVEDKAKSQEESTGKSSHSSSVDITHVVSTDVSLSDNDRDSSNSPTSSDSKSTNKSKEVFSKNVKDNKVENLLSKDASVDKLLQKAADIDADNDAENPSEQSSVWDSDDEAAEKKEPVVKVISEVPIIKTATAEPAVETPKKNTTIPLETKVEPHTLAEKKSQSSPEITAKTQVRSEIDCSSDANIKARSETNVRTDIEVNPRPSAAPEGATSNAANSANKSLNLKQSVDKLSTLVIQMESYIKKLTEDNNAKDDKLASLEAKVNELLEKSSK